MRRETRRVTRLLPWTLACATVAGLACSLIIDTDSYKKPSRLTGCWYRVTDQVDDPNTPENEGEAPGEAWFILGEDAGSVSGCFARLYTVGGATQCPFEEVVGSLDKESATEGPVRILTQNAVVTIDLEVQLNEEDPNLIVGDDGQARPERIDDTLLATVRDELLRDAPFFAKGPFRYWRAPGVGTLQCPLSCGELVVLIDERPVATDPPGPICGEFASMSVQP